MSSDKTVYVLANYPVMGMKQGQTAEMVDSEYLRAVIGFGWLTRVRKADGTEPLPNSDAAASTTDPDAPAEAAAAAADATAAR